MGIDTHRTARRQAVAWGTAGVPLLVALVQTSLALFGYTSGTAGLTPIAEPILSVPVLFEAAVVFKGSSALVMGLFVLIVAAWAAQGAAMLVAEHREVAYGTATLSAVLFFALFFGVYAPLWSADVPAAQLGAFSLVPVCATALQFYAVGTYPWNDVVLEETSGDLSRLESELARLRSTFESEYDARFGGVEPLEAVAPGGLDRLREGAAAFRERLDAVESGIEEARTLDDAEAARAARADVESTLAELSVERRIGELDDGFERALTSGLRTEYGGFEVESRFGGRYRTVNLPTDYRELPIPGVDGPVHVDHVADELVDLCARVDDYAAVASAVDAVEAHRATVREYVSDREATVADRVETADRRLDTVEEQVDALDAPFRDRTEEVFVAGRDPDVTAVRDVRADLDAARDALHDCRFDEAESLAAAAADDARTLTTTVELLSTLEASVDAGHGSVSVPASVPTASIEAVLPSIRAGYDRVEISLADGGKRLAFVHGGADETADPDYEDDSDDSDDGDGLAAGPSRERVASPEAVVDEVLYAFRDFQTGATDDERVVQYRLEDLPDAVATRDVLVNVERFASRQSDLFDAVDMQGPEPPGFIEFTPASDTSAARALDRTHHRFREKYT